MVSVAMILVTMSIIAAGACGAFVLPMAVVWLEQSLNRSHMQNKLIGGGEDKNALLVGLCRNGFVVLRPLARLLLNIPRFRAQCENCVRALAIKGHAFRNLPVCETLLVVGVLLALVGLLLTGSVIVALGLAVVLFALVFGKAGKVLEQWEVKLVEQIPDALRSLGICFNAGYSLQQAFDQTARDVPAPLGPQLRQVANDVHAGRSVEEALEALEKRTRAADLCFAIVALEIQHKTGGSLQDLLENAAEAVVASCDLRRQLTVQTAQARLSAKVVTFMPLVLVAILSVAMEGYLQTFFSSAEGMTILFVALGMEALGVFLIRKILGVDLG